MHCIIFRIVLLLLPSVFVVNGSAQEPVDYTRYEGKTITEIRIIGAKYTKHSVIRNALMSKQGMPFTVFKLHRDYLHLDRLGIFGNFDIRPVLEDNGLILEVEVKEVFPYLPILSVVLGDENGLQFGGGVTSINFIKRALYFSGIVLVGGATNIEFRFRNPRFAGNRTSYQIDFYHRNRENLSFNYSEVADEFYSTLAKMVGYSGRLGARFNFQSIKSDTVGITLSNNRYDSVPQLAFFFGYDSRSSNTNPHSGWWNELEIMRSGFLGFDSNFWRFTFDIRRYIPVMSSHKLTVSSLLTMTTGQVGTDVATWQQFTLGGTNSIRGWSTGSRTGKNEFINTIEYRYNILEPRPFNIMGFDLRLGGQIALFADFGHAWNVSEQFKLNNFIAGYGAGFRLLVPFTGLVRLDFALGESNKGVMLHIGSFEKAHKQRKRVR